MTLNAYGHVFDELEGTNPAVGLSFRAGSGCCAVVDAGSRF